MRGTQTQTLTGRPPISDELWNRVIHLKEMGRRPKDVMSETGLSQTKVYEIFRNPVPRKPEEKEAPHAEA